jgi:uncharacterized membrane protein YhhN
MKTALFVIPFVCFTVAMLIRAEFRQQKGHIYFFKPLSTLLVIAVALLSFFQPAHQTTFNIFVLVGLLFSLGGDVALMFQENRTAFLIGLVSFLLGHVAYTIIFAMYTSWTRLDVLSGILLLAAGLGFYHLIRSNLGALKIPVIVYMLIISVMLNRALATMVSAHFQPNQAMMIAAGAFLFYVSDVMLAANKFWKSFRYHRISLAFYYAGQFLIALSASYF